MSMTKPLAIQAVEAIQELPQQVSAITLREIQLMLPDEAGERNILAQIEVYGHSRVLLCKAMASRDAHQVK